MSNKVSMFKKNKLFIEHILIVDLNSKFEYYKWVDII